MTRHRIDFGNLVVLNRIGNAEDDGSRGVRVGAQRGFEGGGGKRRHRVHRQRGLARDHRPRGLGHRDASCIPGLEHRLAQLALERHLGRAAGAHDGGHAGCAAGVGDRLTAQLGRQIDGGRGVRNLLVVQARNRRHLQLGFHGPAVVDAQGLLRGHDGGLAHCLDRDQPLRRDAGHGGGGVLEAVDDGRALDVGRGRRDLEGRHAIHHRGQLPWLEGDGLAFHLDGVAGAGRRVGR